ncbi:MAG TPA: transcriptional regulator MntR [Acetivibrio sp.]|uniref:transcriptional regulator MntR n=1 Tax=Acetivibrio sp. TaxID=1872092 RepID=UPI002C0A59C3|nr:transcriptional regulator MntR [Acetivibrio sp.]HOM02926.1 transcriptional regulator MntR [Acetivibrio sp.]
MESNEFHTVRGYQLLEQEKKLLTSAMEDYLEMIYRNIGNEGYMRINTLAEMLNVRPSSATKMVQKLFQKGFVEYEKYGIITLTEKGKALGEFLLKRHNIIEKFLSSIGIRDNLLIETELIEHNLSIDTLRSIDQLNSFFEEYPEILKKFKQYRSMKK